MNVISPEIGASNSQSRLLASRLAITYIGWMMTTMDYSQRSRSHSNAKALSTLQKLCCILQNTQTFFSSSQPLLADIFISKTKKGNLLRKLVLLPCPPFLQDFCLLQSNSTLHNSLVCIEFRHKFNYGWGGVIKF